MNWRGRGRRRAVSGLPPATSESKVRLGWYVDRLRRLRLAIEDALKIIDALKTNDGAPADADELLKILGQIAAALRPALDAEQRDAKR